MLPHHPPFLSPHLSHCHSFLDDTIHLQHSLFLSFPFTMAHTWKIPCSHTIHLFATPPPPSTMADSWNIPSSHTIHLFCFPHPQSDIPGRYHLPTPSILPVTHHPLWFNPGIYHPLTPSTPLLSSPIHCGSFLEDTIFPHHIFSHITTIHCGSFLEDGVSHTTHHSYLPQHLSQF